MKRRVLKFSKSADFDLFEAWRLVAERDGEERANAVRSRIMTFLLGLAEFAEIGTRHDDLRPGMRTSGVPGLGSASILFRISRDQVTVIGISYLGRDIWPRMSRMPIHEMEEIRGIKLAVAEADTGAKMIHS